MIYPALPVQGHKNSVVVGVVGVGIESQPIVQGYILLLSDL